MFGSGEVAWKDGRRARFLRMKENRQIDTETTKRKAMIEERFLPAATVPFAGNSLFAFAPCVTSWHAVRNYTGAATRDSIQVTAPRLNPRLTPLFAPCFTSWHAVRNHTGATRGPIFVRKNRKRFKAFRGPI